jgi:hypothetical protein
MSDSQNIDRLPEEALALLAYGFRHLDVGWTKCYMFEVKLDDPVSHLTKGGEGLSTHGGGGSRHYAHHYGDDEWAVIHVDDAAWKAIDSEELHEKGKEILDAMIAKEAEDGM